ncbi:MAG: agmatine deiminase family protein [Candidatus Malihini olakiniferum]
MAVQCATARRANTAPLILSGGSIRLDDEGILLNTVECFLNPDYNPA